MPQPTINPNMLKQLMKEAMAETFKEQRNLLHDIFVEVLEDFAMTEAIRDGQKTDEVSRDDVFQILRPTA